MTHPFLSEIRALSPVQRFGYVRKVAAGIVEANGPSCTLGDVCRIETGDDDGVLAEVVAVEEGRLSLVPFEALSPIAPDAKVIALPARSLAPIGDGFAGRVVDALGNPIDGGPPILASGRAALSGRVLQPLERREPDRPIETGLRAIDGLLTLGPGQRIGVFAAAGVGKTSLLQQIAAQTQCDYCVLCLVGERGREVESAWGALAARQDKRRFSCVAATSDVSPILRARAVWQALCLAESWRDAGRHVLFILDSVTRFAMALREIGLAADEPPTVRAYPPSVFAALPRLVERCGAAKSGGTITAVLSVLSETDDVDDPIVETMKSLLDGHIILSRSLAEQGQFPAIDAPRSVSRLSGRITANEHSAAARRILSLLSAYEEGRLLLDSGLYKPGANPTLDCAVRARPEILEFLKQSSTEQSSLKTTQERLFALARTHA